MPKIRRLQTPSSSSRLYGTKQVAAILGIPEWRVKNFAEGKEYGIPPTIRVGSGRGSRRLYTQADIHRIALANELVEIGFTAEEVGRAVREVPESAFERDYFWESCDPKFRPSETPILIHVIRTPSPTWKYTEARAACDVAEDVLAFSSESLRARNLFGPRSVFILNLPDLVGEVSSALDEDLKREFEREKRAKEPVQDKER